MKNKASFNSELTKFGIGVFETIKVINGKAIFLDEHLSRMYSSVEKLNLNLSIQKSELKDKINYYTQKVDYKALRVSIYDEGYNIQLRDINYTNDDYKEGFKLNISPIKRGQSILYNHKTTNYFENMYSKRYALSKNFNEALIVSLNDEVLEGSMTNIFFIKENKVYTPVIDKSALPGIIRSKVINICKKMNIELIEKIIKLDEIEDFEFCFITNSLIDLMKVIMINNIKYKKENDLFRKINCDLKEMYYGY
ncbi:aminotransferase class IV [Tepidibacter hydrothermalis]|uniref:Aminotransferase class IV n=1 Tax=Tepidibacter hydrothermalis TaxID=3036126 RepID=A0ABY8EJ75_9FIRM|nr:aminotransferase class IV [Tepidibacter hydrothermalis]WFD12115.1 aminotransferase class IV [Tepidibacter hydrothermalis]